MRKALSQLMMMVVVCLSVGLLTESGTAYAQSYPNKPLRLVVPFPPGAGTDMLARTIAAKLTDSVGQPVVVDNKPGGGATIGSDVVAKAAPDGYTVLLSTTSHAINPSVYNKLPYDTLKDFACVTQVATVPTVLVIHPSLPANNIKDLVSFAKANPGKLNVGSAGSGTVFHLAAEYFKSQAGIDMVHVPFKGGLPAVTALLGGQINVLFETTLTVRQQVQAGKLRALAVGSPKRTASMPEVPTVAESGYPGFSAENWYGVYVPAGTPRESVMKLNAEFVKAINLPDVKERFASQGAELIGNTPEQHAAFLKTEMDKWGEIAKLSNARAD